MRRALVVAEWILAAAGVMALAYCAAVYGGMRFFQARASRQFTRTLRPQVAAPPEPGAGKGAVPEPKDGALEARLEIPRLAVRVMVVEGVNSGDLRRAAGHIPGTALPGEPGNVGIAAHRDTFFRPLRNIRVDDTITLETSGGAYRYRVVATKVVAPEEVALLYPTRNDTLTLVTCYPFDYVGAAPRRFVVRAEGEGAAINRPGPVTLLPASPSARVETGGCGRDTRSGRP